MSKFRVQYVSFEGLFIGGKFHYVSSEYQHADILTKALAFDVLATHRRFSMNLSVQ